MNHYHQITVLREVYQNLSHRGSNDEQSPPSNIDQIEQQIPHPGTMVPPESGIRHEEENLFQEQVEEEKNFVQRARISTRQKRPLEQEHVSTGGFPVIPSSSTPGDFDDMYKQASCFEQEFAVAVFEIGLRQSSPKVLKSLMMPTEGLTTEHIKSHLQKYRLHYERSKDEFLGHYQKYLRLDPQTTVNCLQEAHPLSDSSPQDDSRLITDRTKKNAVESTTIDDIKTKTQIGDGPNLYCDQAEISELAAKEKRELAQLQRIQAIHNQLVHEQLELQNTLQAQMHEQLQLQAELNTLMREATAATQSQDNSIQQQSLPEQPTDQTTTVKNGRTGPEVKLEPKIDSNSGLHSTNLGPSPPENRSATVNVSSLHPDIFRPHVVAVNYPVSSIVSSQSLEKQQL